MSVEDNERFYVLDEEDKDIDDSPLNFAAYNLEERDESEEVVANEKDIKKRSPFGILLYIMFNPVEGWKKLRRSKYNVEAWQANCFYPLLAILAISKFAVFFYSVNATVSQVISESVISFVAFFFGYFSIPVVMSWLLPKEMTENFEERFGKEFILVALSTLALFSILTNLLPMLWPVLIFLPIWTLYLMFKGIRFFKFPKKEENKFFVISGVAVIGVPLLIDWALNEILPY